jgi:hypothetical protein
MGVVSHPITSNGTARGDDVVGADGQGASQQGGQQRGVQDSQDEF